MPAIPKMEIFDLMAFFRSETAYYGFIELPKELAVICQQFLSFFPEYVRRATGNELSLDVNRTKNGLKLTTYETPNFDIANINKRFEEYMSSLAPNSGGPHLMGASQDIETKLLELQITLQVQHFRSQLEILQFENLYLKKLVDDLVNVQGIMARNPEPLQITVQSHPGKDVEDLLRKLHALVSGNEGTEELCDVLAEEAACENPDRDKMRRAWEQLCEKAPKVVAFAASVAKLLGL